MSPPGSHSSRLPAVLWIFLLAFAVRLLVLNRFSDSLHFLPDGDDMKFYSDWALRIAGGQWTVGQAFYGLPGYAYCLALVIFVFGDSYLYLVGVLQALLDAGIAVLIWKIASQVFAPRSDEAKTAIVLQRPDSIGLGAALAWTFFTPAQAFSTVMMPTIWLVFAYYLCLSFAVKTHASSWWWPWLGLGLFAGLTAMMVATILFAVPLLLAAIFYTVSRGQPWTERLPKIAAAITVLVAGLYVGASPAWIHNYFIAREPVMLSAHSGINFWIGNNPGATGYPKMPPGLRATQDGLLRDSITLAEEATGHKMSRAEVSKFWSAQANSYISADFVSWMRLMAVKIGNFWNAYQYDDLSIIKLLRDDGVLPPGLKFGFIAALGLAGLTPVLLRFPRATWVAAAVFLHMCALLPVFVTERYRLAAVPGLLILASAGLWIFWENVARARWRPVATYVALCAGAAWFVSIPRADIGLWSLDYYKAGIRATSASELEMLRQNPEGAREAINRAHRNLETAYAYVPNNAEINFALGNVWFTRSNFPWADQTAKADDRHRARLFYGQTLRLNRRHAGTLNNCGVLEMDEKHWELAEKFFAAAVDAEPETAKTYYLLAQVRREMGKIAAAKSALEQALLRRPNQKQFLELKEKLATPPTPPAATGPLPPELPAL
jgi:tetratricopeptide (TPR) repeat protein